VITSGSLAVAVLREELESRETNQMAPTINAMTNITHGSGLASLRFRFRGGFSDMKPGV